MTKVDCYFDFACPFAWAGAAWLEQVREQTGDLEINYRIFPLEQVNAREEGFKLWEQPANQNVGTERYGGSSSTIRSFQGFWAARQQGEEKSRAFNLALFEQRHVNGRNLAGQEVLEAAATAAGLDLDQFRKDLESTEVLKQMEEDYTYGHDELGVFGTPTIVFENGQSAYLQINFRDMPEDPVEFWNEFVAIVRDRPEIFEIKRPRRPGQH